MGSKSLVRSFEVKSRGLHEESLRVGPCAGGGHLSFKVVNV